MVVRVTTTLAATSATSPVHMVETGVERVRLTQDPLSDHLAHIDVLHVVHGLENGEWHPDRSTHRSTSSLA